MQSPTWLPRWRGRALAVRVLGGAGALAWAAIALPERAQWPRAGFLALALALVVALALRPVVALVPRALLAPPRALFVAACAAAAAGVSWWTVVHAMRSEPLSIDSGIYLLQARALAHGHLGLTPPRPFQAFGDRFVLEGPDARLYGIFPPGWPLALAPLAAIGAPMAAGPVVAVALVFAQAALGKALGRAAGDPDGGELATRASLLVSLSSIGRALETADLLSHAFVAALAAFALAGALALGEPQSSSAALRRAAGVGVCLGWALASRLLDGLVLGALVAAVLAWRRPGWRAWAVALAAAAPFALLLALEQRAATGRWLTPTQTLYFARSDWPPTCHRLGLGPDIGCTVEHPGPVSRLGGDGYDLGDLLRVTRERAEALGEDLLGWPPLVLLVFVPLVTLASGVDALAVALLLALTAAYALFYYGNAKFFGARHLFPVAAAVWLAAARGAIGARRSAHARGAGVVVLLAVAVWSVRAPWAERMMGALSFQTPVSDLRRTLERHHLDRGILKTRDLTALASALDPAADGDRRIFTLDDGSGLLELRRAHPELPVFLSLPADDLGRLYAGRPPPGVLFDLETAWPTFVVPTGLAARQSAYQAASGGSVLQLSHASVGARVELPFENAIAGTYRVRVDGFAGPDEGDYAIELDGQPLPRWHGYAPEPAPIRGEPLRVRLDAVRHALVARCVGRDPASSGYGARLDALVGEPVDEPQP